MTQDERKQIHSQILQLLTEQVKSFLPDWAKNEVEREIQRRREEWEGLEVLNKEEQQAMVMFRKFAGSGVEPNSAMQMVMEWLGEEKRRKKEAK